MIIYLDLLNNSFRLFKDKHLLFSKEYDYDLSSFDNKLKAISELLDSEYYQTLKNERSNTLILSDDFVGYGIFNLPNVNKGKIKDMFDTNFRVAYPNYNDFFVNSFELSKQEETTAFFYYFAKRSQINQIKESFSIKGVNINAVNTLSNAFTSSSDFPAIYMLIGEENSELFIVKGRQILACTLFELGRKLLESDQYLSSAYFPRNEIAKRFAGYAKTNIFSSTENDDEGIMLTDPNEGLRVGEPKQLRILKDSSLTQYVIKNNYRKLYARIMDILNFYKAAPWYIPTDSLYIISDESVFVNLNNCLESKDTEIIYKGNIINDKVSTNNSNYSLFGQRIKKERRRIDWKKFLTMEIGGKSKKG